MVRRLYSDKKYNAMKKMYVKPEIEVVELYSNVAILAGSTPESNGPSLGFGGADGGYGETESNERRGNWGNLWN